MKDKQKTRVKHELSPIYQHNSEILILGSLPSVKSREESFYYAHPQNRFWRVLSKVYEENTPKTVEEKREFLKKYKIALWDVIKSCNITGSSDSSIKNVTPNNIQKLLKESNIKRIYTTGKTAYQLYHKYLYPKTKIEAIYLPSTSPANAKMTLENLIEEYQQLKRPKE